MVASVLAGRHWFPLRDEAQPNPPAPKACDCGGSKCKCKVAGECGKAGCATPVRIDESKMATVQAQAAWETPHIVGFAPEWCVACPAVMARLGDGDQLTRIEWRKTEAHFVPTAYPVLYDPTRLKQLAGGNIPATMDEVRKAFGIKPLARGHVKELAVGTVAREHVNQLRRIIGNGGTLQLGNEKFSDVFYGFTVEAPAKFAISWKQVDGVLRIEFPKRPKARYGVLYQDVSAIAIGEDKVTLELPWAPDAVLKID
jgi:hypothetical protein